MILEPHSIAIFGATGGIGACLARQLEPLGCRLTLAARGQASLDALAGELRADASVVDATDSDSVESCLAACRT